MPVHTRKPIEVSPAKDSSDWELARQGENHPISSHRTQLEAEVVGRRTARRAGVEFILKGRDGRIRDRSSFGYDPRGHG